jgi:hypothetical protein
MSTLKPLTTHFPISTPEFTFASFSWPRYVVTLPRGQKSDRIKQHKQPVCGPCYHAPKPEQAGKGKGFYLGDRSAPFALRWQYCDEVAGTRINHTGWYADDYQDTKIRGLVFRLPRGRGFMAGWTMGEGMASAIEGDIYETETEAASAADDLAESTADDEREAREQYEAERLEAEEREEAERLEAALCSAE